MPKSASWAMCVCSPRTVHTEAGPHRCSQHHLALEGSGVCRKVMVRSLCLCPNRRYQPVDVAQRLFPGSGLAVGRAEGETM